MKALEKTLTVLTALAAIAYSLGWLKTFSYFATFGIAPSSIDLTVQDYLFESWFVVENVLFFVLFSWILQAGFRLKLPKLWKCIWCSLLAALGILYLMLPYGTDLAFGHLNCWSAKWLVSHYYSLLKFSPFAVYGLLVLIVGLMAYFAHREWDMRWNTIWKTLGDLFPLRMGSWNHLQVFYIVVLLAWSISLAKHIGAIDGKNRLLYPAQNFPLVTFHISPSIPQLKFLEGNNLYLLHESPKKYFAWDHTSFVFGEGQKARILVIPRESVEWVEASKELKIEPGAMFF